MKVQFDHENNQYEIDLEDDLHKSLLEEGEEALHKYCSSLISKEMGTQSPPKKKIKKEISDHTWDVEGTTLLLKARLEKNDEFNSGRCKKNKLWLKISEELMASGYNVSGKKCEKKFNNLRSTYYRNKERSESGLGEAQWEYYDLMDLILGNKGNIKAIPCLLTDTLQTHQEHNYSVSDDLNLSSDSLSSLELETKVNKLKTPNRKSPDYKSLKLKLEREKFEWKKKQFQEIVRIEEERTKAIKTMTKVLARCIKD